MRIRWGVGLPGPFVVTSGRRRRSGSTGGGLVVLLTVLVLVGLGFEYPVVGVVEAVAAVGFVVWLVMQTRRRG